MKASEVIRRYKAGERDFRRAILRGQSFQGQDLSGADFSEADIRGVNFTNTNLKGASFRGTVAGLTPFWTACLVAFSELVALITGSASGFANIIASSAISATFIQKYTLVPTIGIFAVVAIFFIITIRYGLTIALATLAWTFGLVWTLAWFGARDSASDWTLALVLALGWAWLWAWTGALINVVTKTYWRWIWICTLVLVWTLAGASASAWSATGTWCLAGFASFILSLLGAFIGEKALRGDPRFIFIRLVMIAFGSVGGTSFWQANLCDSDFSQAVLNNSDLRSPKIKRTHWGNTQKLDRARLGDSILSYPTIRELLVTRNGYKKFYVDANLQGANLNGVTLQEANLKLADLSEATLHNADLRGADLSETLVLGADFKGASLTGTCLEAWNIDHTTNLEGVDCQYVYLLQNQQERRPSSGDFAPGEFTKLFQEVLSTVDLIFRNGVDWKAFVTAFRQVQVENEDTLLEIQSIENKGDGVVVVRVSVPPDANKEKIHTEFNQRYELALEALEAKYRAELQAKAGEIAIYREQSANMWEVIKLQAKQEINVQASAEAKAMNESTDRSRNINVGGDLNLSGSTLNLGEISGNVSNTINQLQNTPTPTATELADLLKQLQGAIESDSDLSDTDKTEALEQVGTLAKAGQNPQDGTLKKLANTAVKILKGTVSALPDTAKLVESCAKLLPLIITLLGI